MKGHIARRYGDLAQDLWSGSSRSLAPLKLRVSGSLGKNSCITNFYFVICCGPKNDNKSKFNFFSLVVDNREICTKI